MTSIQLAEFMLWKFIKQKREFCTRGSFLENNCLSRETVSSTEMVCRVCRSPANIPITDKVNGRLISSALGTVSSVSVSSLDSNSKYICKTCLEELKMALSFKKKCKTSDHLFNESQQKYSHDNHQQGSTMAMHDFELIIHQMEKKRSLLKHTGKGLPVHKRFGWMNG